MKTKITLLILSVFFLLIASCEKDENFNTDSNNPTQTPIKKITWTEWGVVFSFEYDSQNRLDTYYNGVENDTNMEMYKITYNSEGEAESLGISYSDNTYDPDTNYPLIYNTLNGYETVTIEEGFVTTIYTLNTDGTIMNESRSSSGTIYEKEFTYNSKKNLTSYSVYENQSLVRIITFSYNSINNPMYFNIESRVPFSHYGSPGPMLMFTHSKNLPTAYESNGISVEIFYQYNNAGLVTKCDFIETNNQVDPDTLTLEFYY